MVGGDVQGRARAASAASTEGGENSPSERTLFFAPAGTAGEKLPSDKMLFFGGTRASFAHNHSVALRCVILCGLFRDGNNETLAAAPLRLKAGGRRRVTALPDPIRGFSSSLYSWSCRGTSASAKKNRTADRPRCGTNIP